MTHWLNSFKYDPISPLLSSNNTAITYFTKRDLLGEKVDPINAIWALPEVLKILKKQQPDGSWPYPGKNPENVYPPNRYSLIETWRQFRFLIDQYEMTKEHPAVEKAGEFLFSFQTEAGDIRGMLANQYAMYYSGAILSLLIKAGYDEDPRATKGLKWLLDMRQNDGGWIASPLITLKFNDPEMIRLSTYFAEPLPLDKSLPSSHNWTGMALRAFVAHEKYRNSAEIKTAASLLKGKFFQEDCYSSYKSADYWVKFQYPFWWNNLVAAMDSISLIGIDKEDKDIKNALQWFIDNQTNTGLWKIDYSSKKGDTIKEHEMKLWISLAICRIFKRFYYTQ